MATDNKSIHRKLKILAISDVFFPVIGGTTTYVDNTCKNLASDGNDVYLITHSTDFHNFPIQKWVKYNSYSVLNIFDKKLLKSDENKIRKFFNDKLKIYFSFYVSELSPDIIHVLYGHYLNKIVNTNKKITPTVWTVHNIPPLENKPANLTHISLLNYGINFFIRTLVLIKHFILIFNTFFDYYIVTNNTTAKALSLRGISKNKICIIKLGVDANLFIPLEKYVKTSNKLFKILTVAAVVPHKGQKILLKALLEVIKNNHNINFINIGPIRDEQYMNDLQKFVLKHNIQNQISFKNSIKEKELIEIYQTADLYVQPSLVEGFCLSALEAASCGLPVIGTNTGEMPKLIEISEYGGLCPINDRRCLSEKIMRTIYNPPTTQERLLQRSKIISHYSWEVATENLFSLYEKTIQEKTNSSP